MPSIRLHSARLWALALLVCATPAGFAAEPAPSARLIASAEPDWPQFRGPRRDGLCDERGLLAAWPEPGPALRWTATNLGRGYSSPVIVQGRLFLTGDVGETLRVFALDLQGHLLWQITNGASWKDPYPGARASVTCNAGRLYLGNAHGRLVCLDAATGREIWMVNLLERFGAKNLTWGLSECLLVDDRNVYATVGGPETLFVAFDKTTGELRWKSPPWLDPERDREPASASYTSPILVQFAGRRLLIGCSLRHLVCVDADTGAFQWTCGVPTTHSVLALVPVLVGDAVFVTAPHGQGGRLCQLLPPTAPTAPVGVKGLWRTRLDSLQGGVVLLDGRLHGAYYSARKGWGAIDARTGATLYEAPDFAKGSALVADGRLYALSEDGWMRLLEPTGTAYAVRGSFRLAQAQPRDAWAHPVIHRGRLYLRYHEALSCYDVRDRATNSDLAP